MNRSHQDFRGDAPVVLDEGGRLRQSNPYSSWRVSCRSPGYASLNDSQVRICKAQTEAVSWGAKGEAGSGGQHTGSGSVGVLWSRPCTVGAVCGSVRRCQAISVAGSDAERRVQLSDGDPSDTTAAGAGVLVSLVEVQP